VPSPPPLPRAQFPAAERYLCLNHAGIAPIPQAAVDAMHDTATAFRDDGGLAFEASAQMMERVRTDAARLAGVPVDDVTFTRNTTAGLALLASGLDWHPGDRVLVPNLEFPSNAYPWLALRDRGVVVDRIEPEGAHWELPIERFADALSAAPTRVVAVSWVQFASGWRTDLAALGALCREHDVLLCVDAIQGLGVLPAHFQEWGVDVAATDAYKWMLGPHGIGFATVSARARAELRVLEPGWASVEGDEDFGATEPRFDPSARRYEGGGASFVPIAGMGASIDLLLGAGLDAVWRHVDALTQRLAGGLVELGAELRSVHDSDNRSGIVSFTLPDRDPDELAARLEARRILTKARLGAVRLAPHAYLTSDDIDVALAAIADLR
jgi:selenocysteine lyase/cysteine desulfurase